MVQHLELKKQPLVSGCAFSSVQIRWQICFAFKWRNVSFIAYNYQEQTSNKVFIVIFISNLFCIKFQKIKQVMCTLWSFWNQKHKDLEYSSNEVTSSQLESQAIAYHEVRKRPQEC